MNHQHYVRSDLWDPGLLTLLFVFVFTQLHEMRISNYRVRKFADFQKLDTKDDYENSALESGLQVGLIGLMYGDN